MSVTQPRLGAAELRAGLELARSKRVAVFVVAYDAESHIEATLRRIPSELRALLADLYVIDDSSHDRTSSVAAGLRSELTPLRVFRTPYNQGYGGNQKLGYHYAIERGYDVVVLLHGDGQYAPEVLPRMLAPFADPDVDAVFGSRMLVPGAARGGGMPAYKWWGNRVLSAVENGLLGTRLSEFHSGYRAYRVATLARLPFEHNTNDFHFDTEIIIQLLQAGGRIVEVPIPTYYGDEICHVYGIPYAWNCLWSVLRARANRLYLLYDPRFDVGVDEPYRFKRAPTSLHQWLLARPLPVGARVVELGAGHCELAQALARRGQRVLAVDRRKPRGGAPVEFQSQDLDRPFASNLRRRLEAPADVVVALDVLEHLSSPEQALEQIHRLLRPGGRLLASTGNVAYLPLRLMLLLGHFNYGKKGILDLTHRRLFTLGSFRRLLLGAGFEPVGVRGFGPPISDMVGSSRWLRLLDRLAAWLARAWVRLFAYQFVVEARRRDSVGDLVQATVDGTPVDHGAQTKGD